jgi:hypothetical protein
MIQMRVLFLSFVVVFCTTPCARSEEEDQPGEPAGEFAVDMDDKPIDPNHRFSDDLTGQPARFYVWYDEEGWHLRSASRANRLRKFTGKVSVSGGRFGRMRAVGFERRGRYADSAQASRDRTAIQFTIYTSNSFDGFDFTVNGDDARVTFKELTIGQQVVRNRIYVGEQGQHPKETTFSFPAQP